MFVSAAAAPLKQMNTKGEIFTRPKENVVIAEVGIWSLKQESFHGKRESQDYWRDSL